MSRIKTNNTPLYKTLEELGLPDAEIRLYILSVSLGPALVSRLASSMGISRPNLYKVIGGLEKRGLGTFTREQGYNKRFAVVSPSRVVEFLREKKKKLDNIDNDITQVMPELLSTYKQGELPTKIKIIKEREMLIEAFTQVFEEAKDEISFFGSSDDLNHFVTIPRLNKLIEKRVRRGIKTNLLVFSGETASQFKKSDKRELRETRIMKGLSPFVTSFYLFSNKAIFWQPKAPLALLIEDEYLVQMFKSIFNHLWRESKF